MLVLGDVGDRYECLALRASDDVESFSRDLVFDGGTLEHVFNFSTALKNCMQMVAPGGRFVSVTMPNNWSGHRFSPVSPALSYRTRSPEHGFSVTCISFPDLDGRHAGATRAV